MRLRHGSFLILTLESGKAVYLVAVGAASCPWGKFALRERRGERWGSAALSYSREGVDGGRRCRKPSLRGFLLLVAKNGSGIRMVFCHVCIKDWKRSGEKMRRSVRGSWDLKCPLVEMAGGWLDVRRPRLRELDVEAVSRRPWLESAW